VCNFINRSHLFLSFDDYFPGWRKKRNVTAASSSPRNIPMFFNTKNVSRNKEMSLFIFSYFFPSLPRVCVCVCDRLSLSSPPWRYVWTPFYDCIWCVLSGACRLVGWPSFDVWAEMKPIRRPTARPMGLGAVSWISDQHYNFFSSSSSSFFPLKPSAALSNYDTYVSSYSSYPPSPCSSSHLK
jgi:hypothetical protein